MLTNIPYPDSDIPYSTQEYAEILKKQNTIWWERILTINTKYWPKDIYLLWTVFSPWEEEHSLSSKMIFNNLDVKWKKVWEIGVGSWINLVMAWLWGASKIIWCDINDDAIKTTKLNLEKHWVKWKIFKTDWNNYLEWESLDVLICNFPILNCNLNQVSQDDKPYYEALCDSNFYLHNKVFSNLVKIVNHNWYLIFCHANLLSWNQDKKNPMADFDLLESVIMQHKLKVLETLQETDKKWITWKTYKVGVD